MAGNGKNAAGLKAGGAILARLKALGVEYVFANAGTDFPPIIEGMVEARARGIALPTMVTVPHEHVAVSMAHGYYQITGRPQAVMLHTNVGLANGVIGAINAACDQVPIFFMSGRTPVCEGGRFGARTVPIGWGQEMYDQAGLIRETTKWDYELRFANQVTEILDRGWAIASSTPKGPVYLSLPREVLCEECRIDDLGGPPRMAPAATVPSRDLMDAAADLLAAARNPLIIAQRGAGTAESFSTLTRFVEDLAIPLSHYWANQIAIPLSSPMHVGWLPGELLSTADVILVINALAPWWPDRESPGPKAEVIHLGPDPLFARTTPVRNFRSDITLAGETAETLTRLIRRVYKRPKQMGTIEERRSRIEIVSALERERVRSEARKGCGSPMSKEWVSYCLGQAIRGRRATVFHELGCPLPALEPDEHLSYFQEPHSGGLGWCLPAAMGARLADPDRLVFATMGDGSYMFSNPTACHLVSESLGLPVITLVLNNEEWGAVRHSVEGLYRDGVASRCNTMPLTTLRPSPDFARTAEASRAHAETITDGRDVPAALERAIQVASTEKRQVLLNLAIRRESLH